MKIKHLFPIFLLLALGTFSSCDLFDKVDDVSFDVTLPVEFVIDENANNPEPITYTTSKLLSATADPEVAKYASKIQEFKINKITYTVSPGADPSTVTFSNGTLKIASTGKTIATISSATLSDTSETELSADTAGFNELASTLLADKEESIQLQGTLSKTPVAFTVTLKFYVTITADAL